MSLVRVQLPEPEFPQISADFLLFSTYWKMAQNCPKMDKSRKSAKNPVYLGPMCSVCIKHFLVRFWAVFVRVSGNFLWAKVQNGRNTSFLAENCGFVALCVQKGYWRVYH